MNTSFQQITPEMICGIVVTYEPDQRLISRLSILSKQLTKLVIIDNSVLKKDLQFIANSFDSEKLLLISNKKNLGLGFALNQGLIEAKKLGYAFVIFFDQDSRIFADSISNMCSIFNCINDKNIGLLGGSYKKTLDKKNKINSFGLTYIKKKSNITSGSLMSLDIFEKVGLFRADYFIDCIDSEFCLRLRKNGYSIYQTAIPIMEHAVGSPLVFKFYKYKFVSTNHSADRRYYIARNHFVMLREYRSYISKVPFFWAFKAIKRSFYFSFIVILFEQQKINKLKAIALGFKDGIFNKMGMRN
ncbi:MAG: hypothetical protein Q7U70_03720 [Methylotenera sp.]|nr:hypothetical protein [Methylotenera sp.]MDO9389053.1 hypothetical protein [Methylotenera sp.]